MELQPSWRKTIEDHFPLVKIKAMERAAAVIANMPIEKVLEKFDQGVVEHNGDDATALNPVAEFEQEMKDAISYAAPALLQGHEARTSPAGAAVRSPRWWNDRASSAGLRDLRGKRRKQNEYQKWLWSCWLDCWKWCDDVIGKDAWACVLNGDLIDGNHHQTREIISPDTGDHMSGAIEILNAVLKNASAFYVTEGTDAKCLGMFTTIGTTNFARRMQVNHMDGNRQNNHWTNLEYVTPAGKSQWRCPEWTPPLRS